MCIKYIYSPTNLCVIFNQEHAHGSEYHIQEHRHHHNTPPFLPIHTCNYIYIYIYNTFITLPASYE